MAGGRGTEEGPEYRRLDNLSAFTLACACWERRRPLRVHSPTCGRPDLDRNRVRRRRLRSQHNTSAWHHSEVNQSIDTTNAKSKICPQISICVFHRLTIRTPGGPRIYLRS